MAQVLEVDEERRRAQEVEDVVPMTGLLEWDES